MPVGLAHRALANGNGLGLLRLPVHRFSFHMASPFAASAWTF
jgi:hypothetical protein